LELFTISMSGLGLGEGLGLGDGEGDGLGDGEGLGDGLGLGEGLGLGLGDGEGLGDGLGEGEGEGDGLGLGEGDGLGLGLGLGVGVGQFPGRATDVLRGRPDGAPPLPHVPRSSTQTTMVPVAGTVNEPEKEKPFPGLNAPLVTPWGAPPFTVYQTCTLGLVRDSGVPSPAQAVAVNVTTLLQSIDALMSA
jgi:hypothetical protein